MNVLSETTEVLRIRREHLNKDNLGKQILGWKEKIAFVLSNKNITKLNKHSVPTQAEQKSSQLLR